MTETMSKSCARVGVTRSTVILLNPGGFLTAATDKFIVFTGENGRQ